MKKKFLLGMFTFFLGMLLSCPVLRAEGTASRLVDSANLLTDSEEAMLLEKLDSISETYQVDVIAAFVPSTEGYPADWYAEYFYDENGYGYGPGRDGVLLLVAMAEREYRILANGFAAQAISPEDSNFIGEWIVSDLTSGDYVEAVLSFAEECTYEIDGELYGFPFDFGGTLLFSLIVGLIAAWISTAVMKGKLKSVSRQTAAGEYTRQGSMQLTVSNDYFLYRTVNRQKKESNSSGPSRGSRSSGPSRHVSGGRF